MRSCRETVTVAVVGDSEAAGSLEAAINAPSPGVASVRVGGSALSPMTRAYRRSSLAIVAEAAAMPFAIAVQRFSRVPWIAALDERTLTELETPTARRARWMVGQAAAVLVERGLAERASRIAPGTRTILPDGSEPALAALRDIALGSDARGSQSPFAPLADGWTFANDRAVRLAIRLVHATGKAPQPIHPQHLVPASWHLWYLQELEGQRVLDIGCGDGAQTLAAARVARSVIAVDIDERQLRIARERAERERVRNVDFYRVDLSDPAGLDPLGRARFEVALALDVLEHLADRAAVLRQVRELLLPGGKLVAAVPNRNTPYKRVRRRLGGFAYADPDHKIEYDERGFRTELEAAGFRVTSLRRGGYDTPFSGFSTLLAPISLRAFARLSARRNRLSEAHPERATAFRVVAVRIDP